MSYTAWMLLGAAAAGFAAGFLLVKTGLDQSARIRKLLQLKDGRLIQTVLWAIIAGSAAVYIIYRLGITSPDLPDRGFWPSLAGGLLAGAGIVLSGLTPVTAASALGRGRAAVCFAIIGMAAAFPAAEVLKKILPAAFDRTVGAIKTPLPSAEFWRTDNPLLWVIGVCLLLIIIVRFSVGKSE